MAVRRGEQLLLLPCGVELPVSHEFREVAKRAFEACSNELALNTQLAYAQKWKAWCDWCEMAGIAPLPIDPRHLIVFFQDCSESGRTRSWIKTCRFALAKADTYSRITTTERDPDAIHQHPLVRAWWRSYVRNKPIRTKHAPDVRPDGLRAIVHAVFDRALWKGERTAVSQARNRLLILFGYYGACRRSELIAFRRRDVTPTDAGLLLYFAKSKTDQRGEGAEREIFKQEEALLCPVDAWRVWSMHLDQQGCGPEHFLFPPIDHDGKIKRSPMLPRSMLSTFHTLATLSGHACTPHSLRAAFATHALLSGHDPLEIAHHGRWKSVDTLQVYVRRSRLGWGKNPTRGLALLSKKEEEGRAK